MITATDLHIILPAATGANIDRFWQPLNDAMEEFQINSAVRQAAFLAQIGHESGSLRYVRELASGAAYEGRADLGNTEPGDGRLFKGWGLMQTTGRKNTRIVSLALFGDERLVDDPSLITSPSPELCARAAGHFWTIGAGLNLSKRAIAAGVSPGCNLNDLADDGKFELITLAVNGGLNGQAERLAIWERAKEQLA